MNGDFETIPPVVVGVDGSPASYDAVRWAACAAVLRGVPLLVVTTRLDAFATAGSGVPAAWLTVQQGTARDHLRVAAETARAAAADVVVRTEMDSGTPSGALVARSHHARLLVVGSRGLGELTGGLVGSVSSAVVQHAACPVVVVRGLPGVGEPALTGPVVVGVDNTSASEPAVAEAFEEASLRGTELVAVHAWTDLDLAETFRLESPHRVLAGDDLTRGEGLALAGSLDGCRGRYPHVTVTPVLVADRPVTHLLEQAASAQLVVVGSRGRGGFVSMLLGSTSRALLHATPCPLMVVRSPAAR